MIWPLVSGHTSFFSAYIPSVLPLARRIAVQERSFDVELSYLLKQVYRSNLAIQNTEDLNHSSHYIIMSEINPFLPLPLA